MLSLLQPISHPLALRDHFDLLIRCIQHISWSKTHPSDALTLKVFAPTQNRDVADRLFLYLFLLLHRLLVLCLLDQPLWELRLNFSEQHREKLFVGVDEHISRCFVLD